MKYIELECKELEVKVQGTCFVPADGMAECHLMLIGCNCQLSFGVQLENLCRALCRAVAALPAGMRPVFKRYFLSDGTNQGKFLPQQEPCAVSVVTQAPLSGAKCALWVYLQQDVEVHQLSDGFFRVSHNGYSHYWRGGYTMPGLTSYCATVGMLENYSAALAQHDCTMLDNCLRTWFFVRDVDLTYKGVVNGRNEIFAKQGLTPQTHFIASTGICGAHPDPAVAVALDTYAVKGIIPAQTTYLQAPDFLNPTYQYGVAFERATAVDYGDRRHIFVSGTASIDAEGQIVCADDIVGQTDRMLTNVEALLSSADAGWDDATHAVIYLRDMADYSVVSDIFSTRLPRLPLVIVLAPVCRPGWLIEMECMAVKPISDARYAPL